MKKGRVSRAREYVDTFEQFLLKLAKDVEKVYDEASVVFWIASTTKLALLIL